MRFASAKNYVRAAWIMGSFAVLATYLPKGQRGESQPEIYFGIPVSAASVKHEFFNDSDFTIQELNGVRVQDAQTGKITFYFEYIANKQDTLRRIKALPFLKDNRKTSLSCELMNAPLNPLDSSALTENERNASAFFWNARAEEFTVYECYKSPVKHTLLLSKTSDRIFHRVEVM